MDRGALRWAPDGADDPRGGCRRRTWGAVLNLESIASSTDVNVQAIEDSPEELRALR